MMIALAGSPLVTENPHTRSRGTNTKLPASPSAVVVAEPGELAVKHTEHLVLAGVWTDNPAG